MSTSESTAPARARPNTTGKSRSGWPTAPAHPGGRRDDRRADGRLSQALRHLLPEGRAPTSEAGLIKLSLRTLHRLYGHTPAAAFGPLALRTVQQAYIDAGPCRTEVNRRTRHVVRFFKFLVSRELGAPIRASRPQDRRGDPGRARGEVREAKPVKPVPDAYVDAIKPHVSRQVWAMIEMQRLTGMRPGEAVIMRTADLDTSGRIWVDMPERHKTEHHNVTRQVYLGPLGRRSSGRGSGPSWTPISSVRPRPRRNGRPSGAGPARRRSNPPRRRVASGRGRGRRASTT